jgi:hypothetical protein
MVNCIISEAKDASPPFGEEIIETGNTIRRKVQKIYRLLPNIWGNTDNLPMKGDSKGPHPHRKACKPPATKAALRETPRNEMELYRASVKLLSIEVNNPSYSMADPNEVSNNPLTPFAPNKAMVEANPDGGTIIGWARPLRKPLF